MDPALVAKLAGIACTMSEIAAVAGCSVDTLQRRFAAIIKDERERGCASLRREQWRLALAGDRTMLIWLGKNHLGQTDRAADESRPNAAEVARAVKEAVGAMLAADGLRAP